ncbi:DNA topoisomerase 2-binding protein 1 isoform X1, partial [Tanacetum coccineum]
DGHLLDISSHILFSPLQYKVPLLGFIGLQFCVSQYEEKDRNLLRSLCHVIGGKLNNKLTKKINFLVCKFSDGPKYEAACQWGVQSVTIEWIWECVKQVSGPSGQMTWIRGCPTSLDNWNIHIDNSLLRAQTDYIDHYQLHWPDRYVLMFGETYYDPARQYSYVSFDEQLATLGKAVDADYNLAIALDGDYMKAISRRANLNEKIRDYEAALDFKRLIRLLEKRSLAE